MSAFRRRRSLLVVRLSLAGALAILAAGLFVSIRAISPSAFAGPSQVVVTFSAAPGGHISPDGAVTVSVDSPVSVSTWSDDPQSQPWLMVDGRAVETTAGSDGRATYELRAEHDETVIASFAQLASNARVLDATTTSAIESIASDGSEITFSAPSPLLTGLAVDDVLVNGTSWQRAAPLMVRVTGINRSGSRTIVETKPATLLEVLSSASIQIDVPLQATGNTPVASLGGWPIAFGPPAAYAADDSASDPVGVEWSDDRGRNVTASAGVAIGSPRLQLTIEFCCGSANPFDFHLPRLQRFEVAVSETASANVSLTATGGAELSKEKIAFDHSFAAISPLPFVWVTPQIEIGMGAAIHSEAAFSVSANASATTRVGVRWQDNWAPIYEASSSFSGNTSVTLGGQATVYPLLRATANVNGLCGPYFEIRPGQFDMTADVSANPWWELDAGIGVSGGAKCVFSDPYEMGSALLVKQRIASSGSSYPTPTPYPTPTVDSSTTPQPTLRPTSPPAAATEALYCLLWAPVDAGPLFCEKWSDGTSFCEAGDTYCENFGSDGTSQPTLGPASRPTDPAAGLPCDPSHIVFNPYTGEMECLP